MKPINNFKAVTPNAAREILPAGGYVAKIMDAEEKTYDWGSVLLISFDIVEGEYSEFFAKDYRAQSKEYRKWRGVLRQPIPKEDGSDKDEWTKNAFSRLIGALEDSNSGYHWDWNEKGMKGKMVGVLLRDREWEYNGDRGWTTECCSATTVDIIREKKFRMPKAKPLTNNPITTETNYNGFTEVNDDELPF